MSNHTRLAAALFAAFTITSADAKITHRYASS
jgi:hypothetical protein